MKVRLPGLFVVFEKLCMGESCASLIYQSTCLVNQYIYVKGTM